MRCIKVSVRCKMPAYILAKFVRRIVWRFETHYQPTCTAGHTVCLVYVLIPDNLRDAAYMARFVRTRSPSRVRLYTIRTMRRITTRANVVPTNYPSAVKKRQQLIWKAFQSRGQLVCYFHIFIQPFRANLPCITLHCVQYCLHTGERNSE